MRVGKVGAGLLVASGLVSSGVGCGGDDTGGSQQQGATGAITGAATGAGDGGATASGASGTLASGATGGFGGSTSGGGNTGSTTTSGSGGSGGEGGSASTGAGGAPSGAGGGDAGGAGVGGGGSGGGGAGGGSSSGAGGGPVCKDTGPGEPNDTELEAYKLGKFPDDAPEGTVYGVLVAGEVDWYVYSGEDTFGIGNTVDPSVNLDLPGLRVCQYVECLSKQTDLSCPAGTTPDKSPGGRKGCCGSGKFTFEPDCKDTISDDANVYIRVDDPNGQAKCEDYALKYHY